MARYSTNALAKRFCESQGWLCETVQTVRGPKRHDLFGIGDSLALPLAGAPKLIQNCSYGSLKAHRDAIGSDEFWDVRARLFVARISLELWEWRRKKLKRGGKNLGREWYLRTQRWEGDRWGHLGGWEGPFDLYPRNHGA